MKKISKVIPNTDYFLNFLHIIILILFITWENWYTTHASGANIVMKRILTIYTKSISGFPKG